MEREPELVSTVVPVFNSEATLRPLVERLDLTFSQLGADHEVLLVDDGSADGSWETILELCREHESVRGIALRRNFGQHNALLAGIQRAGGDVTVTLDDDLQNPPEEIPKLLAALGPTCDVVYGRPLAKRHQRWRNLASRAVGGALAKLGGGSAPMVSSFRAFKTELRSAFSDYRGPDVSVDALLTWGTVRFASVDVEHHERAGSASQYGLVTLIRHALTMITAFSTRPLRLATMVGFGATVFGLCILVYVLARYAINGGSVPGFPFLASLISILAGAQLFSIGMIGEYLARVHVRVMDRPSYVIRTDTATDPVAPDAPAHAR